tara:strand:- start:124 stop:1029 length:906 start_codon:yes stop_codon:yes gene_type:complete
MQEKIDGYQNDLKGNELKDKVIDEQSKHEKGRRFEITVAELFKRQGFVTTIMGKTGDQGCDIMASKGGKKNSIQAKFSLSNVDNGAVQEVLSSLAIYNADHGIVVTNNFFTKGARTAARANNIELIDRNQLIPLLSKYGMDLDDQNNDGTGYLNPTVDDCVKCALKVYEETSDKLKTVNAIKLRLINSHGLLLDEPKFVEYFKTIIFKLNAENSLKIDIIGTNFQFEERPRSEVSKMQVFVDVIKSLEGEHKTPVEEKQLVEELVKTEKFGVEEAKNFIRKMARDSLIYESKPGCYNILTG